MPTSYIKQMAEEQGISVAKAEKYWEEAKEAAKKSYDEDKDSEAFYGTTTNIFKSIIKKRTKKEPEMVEKNVMNFEDFLNEKKLV